MHSYHTHEESQKRAICEQTIRDTWDFIVDIFQDFVLIFQNLQFTKGKRRMLLFLVLKTEGDIFQELRDFDKAIKAYKAL